MVDWEAAGMVALFGLVSVFAVLIILQLAVQATGAIIDSRARKQKENISA